jgi:uncharacterized protein (DUF697 family)
MKLVWRIGQAHGFALDRAQVVDFLGVLGVGLAGQYVEQIGRRLLGGLLGGVLGSLGRAAGSVATGAAMSFATTWAIGQVARRYYAADRTLDAQTLREAFADLLARGQALRTELLPQIEARARTLDPSRILQLVQSR